MVTIRNAAIIALLLLVGACVKLGYIQQQDPVRTMNFTGSHQTMAQCIQSRIGGRVQVEPLSNAYIVYDSVKVSMQDYGVTHYSVTVAQTAPGQGSALLRIVWAADTPHMRQQRLQRAQSGQQQLSPVGTYWIPVQACAAQVESAK